MRRALVGRDDGQVLFQRAAGSSSIPQVAAAAAEASSVHQVKRRGAGGVSGEKPGRCLFFVVMKPKFTSRPDPDHGPPRSVGEEESGKQLKSLTCRGQSKQTEPVTLPLKKRTTGFFFSHRENKSYESFTLDEAIKSPGRLMGKHSAVLGGQGGIFKVGREVE